MIFKDALLADFDHEIAVTRRLLERVPDSAFGWSPHAEAWTMGALATHLAQLLLLGCSVLERDDYDVVAGAAGGAGAALPSVAAVLELFDGHVSDLRRQLADLTEGAMLTTWSLRRNGDVLLSLPRTSAFRSLVLHQLIHHRGQLTVYLRLQDVPLPPMYAATAGDPS